MKKLFFFFLVLISFSFFLGYYIFIPSSSNTENIFSVKPGQGVKEISQDLKNQGIIKNKFLFETYVWFKRLEKKFQAGEYKLKPSMEISEIVNILTSGKALPQENTLTIIEGWRAKEIGDYLEKNSSIKKNQFLEEISKGDYKKKYSFLNDKPSDQNLEGYLFPDTYRVFKNSEAGGLVKKMLDNFDRKLTSQIREEIKKQNKTIFEIIVLASILEKEIPTDKEMALAADVFNKRLKIGMMLQADSTVNFITGKKLTQVTYEDLKIDSPYNTYKYPGLPPGPISNPGLSAIKAAVYPLPNDYWFFLTTKDKKIIFSKTLEEHNLNKAKYLD